MFRAIEDMVTTFPGKDVFGAGVAANRSRSIAPREVRLRCEDLPSPFSLRGCGPVPFHWDHSAHFSPADQPGPLQARADGTDVGGG